MLKLITGSVRSALSDETVSDMVRAALKEKERKFIIIVPEQFTLRTQQRVVALHPSHACMNIDVVSFDRLAHVVLSKMGKDVSDILDDTGKALILRNVLDDVRDDLVVYGSKVRSTGFAWDAKSLVTELKQYGIDDNDLYMMQEKAGDDNSLLVAKLQDIRLIYRKFNDSVEDKYITAEELLDVFARYAPESDFIRGSSIYLDGFTGFTPIQYKLIGKMLKMADVTCSITAEEGKISADCPEYDLFYMPSQTYTRLEKLAEDAGVEVVSRSVGETAPQGVNVISYSCSDIRDEAEFAAGEILRLVREGGCRYRDIAVLASDMETYHGIIEGVFRRAGISVFIDHKTEIGNNLLIRFIMAAVDVSVRGLTHEPVFTFLKSYLAGADPDEIAMLENYCLEFNIKGRPRWEVDFTANRELRSGDPAWDLERINDIRRRVIRPLLNFYGRTRSEKKASVFASCLKKLLEDYDVRSQIEKLSQEFEDSGDLTAALQYGQIYGKAKDLIEQIQSLLGDEVLTPSEFADTILSGTAEIKIGTIPPSADAVMAGDLTRTRLDDIKHLFVLGMNDGKVPRAGGTSSLFTQKERELLREDFEIAPTVLENLFVQRYYLYLAFNRPSESLYLSFASSELSGERLSPSCIFEDLDELVLNAADKKTGTHRKQDDHLWRERAMDLLAEELRHMAAGDGSTDSRADAVLEYYSQAEPETVRMLAHSAAYTNEKSALDSRIAEDLYGQVLYGSVSRYETYYMCPYRHFLNYGLRIEKRREFKVEAADLGTIYHDALERYSKRIGEEGFSFRDIGDEDSHRIIAECVEEAIEATGGDVLSSTSRNEYFKKRIAQISSRTTDILRAHVRAGLFEPQEYEYSFRDQLSDNIEFRGKIDRIDIYDADDIFVKIIDYKSGSKKFSIRDIYSGLQLQLVAYMGSAVRQIADRNPGRNVRPGGVYYYLVNDKYVKPEEIEVKNRMSGLTLADDEVIHAVDSTLGTEGVSSSNIIPVSYTKTGIGSRSVTCDSTEFDNLMGFVSGKINDAGKAIREGDIALAPYRESAQHNGCSFCDYKDICRFEAGRFGTDWRECDADDDTIKENLYGRHKMD